jgi:hypothetical protein
VKEDEMANLKDWVLEMAESEEVEGVVIGEMGWGDYHSERVLQYEQQPKNKLLTWTEAQPLIDYEFDSGFGAPGCNAIYAWTKSWIIAIAQYDGATFPFRIPRNPRDVKPEMPGG